VTGLRNPGWVDAILDFRGTALVARIALASAYILGGLTKLFDFPGAVAEQAHFGLHPAALWAVVTIVVELAASVLVISGRWVWLGAGALGVLTGMASLVANNFWAMTGHDRFMATNAFFEHLGLIGGFVLVAVLASAAQRRGGRAPARTLH
jgi:uncharacterized membrane protein YphA (DoxX/SURF4 family)